MPGITNSTCAEAARPLVVGRRREQILPRPSEMSSLARDRGPVRCRPHRKAITGDLDLAGPAAPVPSRSCTPPQFIGSELAYRTEYREQLVWKRLLAKPRSRRT
jgi:hypothetical protein